MLTANGVKEGNGLGVNDQCLTDARPNAARCETDSENFWLINQLYSIYAVDVLTSTMQYI